MRTHLAPLLTQLSLFLADPARHASVCTLGIAKAVATAERVGFKGNSQTRRGGGLARLFQPCLRLLKPEPHAHLAKHCPRSVEVCLALLGPAASLVELAEAQVTAGHQGAHAEFLGQPHGRSVMAFGWLDILGSPTGGDIAEEVEHPRLVAALPAFSG